ncbi:hypothetical protein AMTR_s00002p00246420 [Amborella trichopoda]|uniref:Uncharacterized protein n=1 Tax=Amborella trichopoda TaxID=13333 RepID=W1P2T4_AMBTC|nr:hypothetical protein AMTR_s00002p00246420 [Amborella trichopoda]
MAIVADGTIQGKEGLHIVSDIRRSHDVIHCEMSGLGMNEGGTGVIALDVDGSISTRGQAPHEREEVSEAISQGDLEAMVEMDGLCTLCEESLRGWAPWLVAGLVMVGGAIFYVKLQ